jgi:hypothetical protein
MTNSPATPKDIADPLLSHIAGNSQLVIRFFVVFARFEYALKRAGFATQTDRGIRIDWTGFAKRISDSIEPSDDYLAAAEYFKSQPPRRQVIGSNGQLDFEPKQSYQNPLSAPELAVLVARVRNNLFHGGKFPISPVFDSARNRDLLEGGLVILSEFLAAARQAVPEIADFFFGDLDP